LLLLLLLLLPPTAPAAGCFLLSLLLRLAGVAVP
jgi:hypothetical protein